MTARDAKRRALIEKALQAQAELLDPDTNLVGVYNKLVRSLKGAMKIYPETLQDNVARDLFKELQWRFALYEKGLTKQEKEQALSTELLLDAGNQFPPVAIGYGRGSPAVAPCLQSFNALLVGVFSFALQAAQKLDYFENEDAVLPFVEAVRVELAARRERVAPRPT